jgi:hypothetical protein
MRTLIVTIPPGEEPSPWEQLKKIKTLPDLKIYDSPSSSAPVKPFRIDMKDIRNAIEKAGIQETIKIDLYSKKQKLLARLGKYKPVLEKEGEEGVFFDSIPDIKEFYFTQQKKESPHFSTGARDAEETYGRYYLHREGPELPNECFLYIRGKKGKKKVKILVTLTYLRKVI